jgi:TolB protein
VDEQFNVDPSWSPDGRRIAFAKGGSEIYTMNVDGTGLTRLTDNPGHDNRPTWSPDGSRIAFASQRNGDDYQIYVMNADGTGLARLTFGPGQAVSPVWSPDGTNIAFWRLYNGGAHLFVVTPDASGLLHLGAIEGHASGPSWSPDGSWIAFGVGGDMYATSRKGNDVRRLISGAKASEPSWCCSIP